MKLPKQIIAQTPMNTTQFINDKLTPIFRDIFDDDELVISEVTTAQDVEGWDSLANIRVMVSVEKALGVRFTAAEISNLRDVGALADLVLTKRASV